MQQQQILQYHKPLAVLVRMLADPSFYLRKYQALGFEDVAVLEQEHKAQQFRIRAHFLAEPALPLPGLAKKFVNGAQDVTQEDCWDFAKASGELRVEIRNLPITIVAAMQLSDTPQGARNTLLWDVRCAVPLIGSKLEEIMLAELQEKVSRDVQISLPMLADY